jgi:hypothetical protein
MTPTLERLTRANPVRPDDELGRTPAAQATLERILATERPAAQHMRRRRGHGHRLAVVLVTALLVAVGGAVAATDPFGLFRSPNPGSAVFGIDPSRHVRPPTTPDIGCPRTSALSFACRAGVSGQRYRLIEHVWSPGPRLTRGYMLRALRQEARKGQLSAQGEKRLEQDIAAVSDQFLARFSDMMRFGTFSTSLTPTGNGARVPPAGVPSLLICEPAGLALRCRDMNGDDSAPVGGGIYAAVPASDWRPAPPEQPDSGWDLEVAILGHVPTAAELRFEVDLARYGTTSSSASPARPQRARAPSSH